MRLKVLVQDAELPNDAAAFVGQKRVFDVMLLGESP